MKQSSKAQPPNTQRTNADSSKPNQRKTPATNKGKVASSDSVTKTVTTTSKAEKSKNKSNPTGTEVPATKLNDFAKFFHLNNDQKDPELIMSRNKLVLNDDYKHIIRARKVDFKYGETKSIELYFCTCGVIGPTSASQTHFGNCILGGLVEKFWSNLKDSGFKSSFVFETRLCFLSSTVALTKWQNTQDSFLKRIHPIVKYIVENHRKSDDIKGEFWKKLSDIPMFEHYFQRTIKNNNRNSQNIKEKENEQPPKPQNIKTTRNTTHSTDIRKRVTEPPKKIENENAHGIPLSSLSSGGKQPRRDPIIQTEKPELIQVISQATNQEDVLSDDDDDSEDSSMIDSSESDDENEGEPEDNVGESQTQYENNMPANGTDVSEKEDDDDEEGSDVSMSQMTQHDIDHTKLSTNDDEEEISKDGDYMGDEPDLTQTNTTLEKNHVDKDYADKVILDMDECIKNALDGKEPHNLESGNAVNTENETSKIKTAESNHDKDLNRKDESHTTTTKIIKNKGNISDMIEKNITENNATRVVDDMKIHNTNNNNNTDTINSQNKDDNMDIDDNEEKMGDDYNTVSKPVEVGDVFANLDAKKRKIEMKLEKIKEIEKDMLYLQSLNEEMAIIQKLKVSSRTETEKRNQLEKTGNKLAEDLITVLKEGTELMKSGKMDEEYINHGPDTQKMLEMIKKNQKDWFENRKQEKNVDTSGIDADISSLIKRITETNSRLAGHSNKKRKREDREKRTSNKKQKN